MTETYREHEMVELARDIPAEGLTARTVGTIVYLYGDRITYEVEFVVSGGKTIAVVTVTGDCIRPRT